MIKFLSIIRIILVWLLLSIGVAYTAIYILLSVNSVQNNIANKSTKYLSEFLDCNVSIEKVKLSPFNRAAINNIVIFDKNNDTLFYAKKANASLRLLELLKKEIVISSISVSDFCIHINKKNEGSDLNINFLIDKFKNKKRNPNPPKLAINTLLLQGGHIKYDVTDAEYKDNGLFDKNHIDINDALINASLKSISRDSINISVRALRLSEKSGFYIKNIAFKLIGNKENIRLRNFAFDGKESKLRIKENYILLPKDIDANNFMEIADLNFGINNGILVLSDFSSFIPIFKEFNTPINISCAITGNPNHLFLDTLKINYANDGLVASGYGSIDNIFPEPKNAFIFGEMKELNLTSKGAVTMLNDLNVKLKDYSTLYKIKHLSFKGQISGFTSKLVTYGEFKSGIGNVETDMTIEKSKGLKFKGNIKSNKLDINKLISDKGLGEIAFNLKLDGSHSKSSNTGKVKGEINLLEYNNYKYKNIAVDAKYADKEYIGSVALNDSNIILSIDGLMNLSKNENKFALKLKGENIKLNDINLTKKYEGSLLNFDIDANFTGNRIDNADGEVVINSFSFANNGEIFVLDSAYIKANNSASPQFIEIKSELINGNIIGKYKFSSLKNSFIGILSEVMPTFFINKAKAVENYNRFKFGFKIPNTELLTKTFELPFMLSDENHINGYYNDSIGRFSVGVEVPSFSTGKIFLENSNISLEKFGDAIQGIAGTRHITSKGIKTDWNIASISSADSCHVNIDWQNTKNPNIFSGDFATTAHFLASQDGNIVDMMIYPSTFTISDSIWNIAPATLFAQGKEISIHDFEIARDNQHLKINGEISKNPEKQLNINLKQIDLSYIFDVLNRRNIVFGGEATGDVNISEIYRGGMPVMKTDGLFVKDFSYNHSVFGDLDVESKWDDEEKAICFDGEVSQPNIEKSKVMGRVMPTRDSLYFYIDAHKLRIGFIQPFTEKIMSGVGGRVSGVVEFFGRFKALNVVANAYAENFNFGIDYLNTRYYITDSVKLDKKGIWAKNITIKDKFGHTGKADMALEHTNFKKMKYEITLHDVNNFLVFDVTEKLNPLYYGTVFGTGSGLIKGDGLATTISVNMRTNPNSNFTFALLDEEDAGDYKFITYIDKDATEVKEVEVVTEKPWERFSNINITTPKPKHKLHVNLRIDATRDAMMRLVIDPATNDQIKAWGEGGIRIEYDTNDELGIYGTYTAEKGSYSLNLQDLISKDFIVEEGSSISFTGDPMNANLNIGAYYNVQANLLDLDESFAHENELNRTTVPVHTTLHLTGNLQKPEFTFDLTFPTLSQNIYRRVKTIINSDDMMNRQVLYLLALNKFYTPEYMSVSERHNNELAAVASSALSSQLNNILGQISENFNIGTNFRSDKGDFTDLEFDVVLSSQLLNNRLIFNGNLGYRDKSVSNNSFIGDFDLEYLINKSGTFRLKAYNHYNDKNYYIKSALTTQGVGVMFKKDFNKAIEIFKRNPEDVADEKAKREKRKARREERKEKRNSNDE